ncbi:MAG: DUF6370 family protein [Bacteroidota bacterium]|nr:DUF6370 family protein [Ferruginibacter sp.]
MKLIVLIAPLLMMSFTGRAQTPTSDSAFRVNDASLQVVEAACGQCRLGLPGKDCNLAVRIDGKAYFVDGTTIDEHGDAHAPDGFCQAIRKAEVKGAVVNNRFKASYFKLLPAAPKKAGGTK